MAGTGHESPSFRIIRLGHWNGCDSLRRHELRASEEWGQKHQDEPYLNWQLARAGRPPQKIADQFILCQITGAEAHPDHTVTMTWADGARGIVDFAPFIARGELFTALQEPDYFVREIHILRGGIGLSWPNEVDFASDGLRQDAFLGKRVNQYCGSAGAGVNTRRS